MKKSTILLCAFVWCTVQAVAQKETRFLVRFANKNGTAFSLTNGAQFLSTKSLARRSRYSIALDSTDLPVSKIYIDSLRAIPGVQVLNISRWLNCASVFLTDSAARAKVQALSFVQSFEALAGTQAPANRPNATLTDYSYEGSATATADTFYRYGVTAPQINIHNGAFLHNLGLRGQGMVVGMLDAGFQNYLTVSGFDSARRNGQIKDQWDFVVGDSNVNNDHSHGTTCFSVIAGNLPGQFVGSAPAANFHLYRTEDVFTEFPIEELNWVCAAERLDSAGGDVISSSLGYMFYDSAYMSYRYEDLNGNKTINARGADLAAKKGLLVVNAAGNFGANPTYKYIMTPADGDSVLAVGQIDTAGVIGVNSSWGPSADGRIKPDVVSVGVNAFVQNSSGGIGPASGTSYACPNMAGIATCLWQGFPELSNMRIFDALRTSGNRSATPDNRYGYGIPDAKKAMGILLKQITTSSISINNCVPRLSWTGKDNGSMRYVIERRLPADTAWRKIADVYGTGATFAGNSYQFTDTAARIISAGSLSYRIQQVLDTSATGFYADYVDTVAMTTTGACTPTSLNNPAYAQGEVLLLPNPVRTLAQLRINNNKAVRQLTVIISAANGAIVRSEQHSKSTAPLTISLNIATLAQGRYNVALYNGRQLLVVKEMVKL